MNRQILIYMVCGVIQQRILVLQNIGVPASCFQAHGPLSDIQNHVSKVLCIERGLGSLENSQHAVL